jgi:hypothetical protein
MCIILLLVQDALFGGGCYSDRFSNLPVHLSIFPAKRNEQKANENIIESHTLSEQFACGEIKK